MVKNRFIRSFGVAGAGDAEIRITVPGDSINGFMKFRRYKSYDEWKEIAMIRDGKFLVAYIPQQPPAGKVMYQVFVEEKGQRIALTEEPVIIRFRGHVPPYIIIPHIILIFMAMFLSTRTGVEVLSRGTHVFQYTRAAVILLLIGGMIMGPIVQKYAFGAFWTGWPFGHDLTDNKTFVAFVMWVIAYFVLRRNREKTGWALAASILLVLIYLIPHSVLGSEIDYTAKP
jgi:hypothetical protein